MAVVPPGLTGGYGVIHKPPSIHRDLAFPAGKNRAPTGTDRVIEHTLLMRSHHSRHSNRKGHQNIPTNTGAAQPQPPTQPPPGQSAEPQAPPVGRHSVSLGANPGALFASLPAMLGFKPQESLVLIGLDPVGKPRSGKRRAGAAGKKNTVTFQIGPVVRADLNESSSEEAIETFCDALGAPIAASIPTDQCPQAIILGVGQSLSGAVRAFELVRKQLAAAGIPVYASHWAPEVRDGASWGTYDLDTELWVEEGTIPAQEENPMTLHAGVTNALSFDAREGMEHWLDGDGPPLPEGPTHRSLDEALWQLFEATADVLDGLRRIEDAMADRELLSSLAELCTEPSTQAYVILASVGMPSPVIRSLLAETARCTEGPVRSKVLYVLTQVLVGNGEGVIAFHTARRAAYEADSPEGWKDNHVLVLALKAGLALEIVKDKASLAADLVEAGRQAGMPERTVRVVDRVVDWDAVRHLRALDAQAVS